MKKLEAEKQSVYRKCLCDTPKCGKCLAIHCEQPDCSIHTQKLKNWYKQINSDRFSA